MSILLIAQSYGREFGAKSPLLYVVMLVLTVLLVVRAPAAARPEELVLCSADTAVGAVPTPFACMSGLLPLLERGA